MLPVQITIRDIASSKPLEIHLRQKAQKLTHFNDKIISCRIVVELLQKHKHQGKLYNARIDVAVPGKELAVTKKCNEDVYVAIRDAFSAIERKIEEYARKRHGRVKSHDNLLHGHIVRLLTDEGYGFIEGTDGNEYYFSMTNVSYPQFDQLVIGDAVGYIPHPLSEGWQAHRVTKDHKTVT
jgi:ribosomal subunit interface protein